MQATTGRVRRPVSGPSPNTMPRHAASATGCTRTAVQGSCTASTAAVNSWAPVTVRTGPTIQG